MNSCMSKNVGVAEIENFPINKFFLDEIVLQVDKNDSCKPGFDYFKDSESIAVNSIFLNDDFCFLLDPFHHNIKKVNLNTGEVKCSDPSQIRFKPFSFVVSNDLIYVLTHSTINYVFSTDLEFIREIELPTSKKHFVGFEGSNIILYIQMDEEIITINKEGMILNRKKGSFDFQEFCNGKTFEIIENENSSVLKNEFGEFDLGRKFPHTWEYYDSFNLDFDNKNIVYFSSNPDSLVIYVKKIEK